MKVTIAALIILLGVYAFALKYQHNKYANEIHVLEQENFELLQKNRILRNRDIVNKKSFTILNSVYYYIKEDSSHV
jgi:hypothetical protein